MSSVSPLQRKILLQHNKETKDSELTIFKQLLILIEKCHPYDTKELQCHHLNHTATLNQFLFWSSLRGNNISRNKATMCLKYDYVKHNINPLVQKMIFTGDSFCIFTDCFTKHKCERLVKKWCHPIGVSLRTTRVNHLH